MPLIPRRFFVKKENFDMERYLNTYAKYGALSAILAVSVVYGMQRNLVPFLMGKFPEPMVQVVVAGIIATFLFAYLRYGHAGARDISLDLRSLTSQNPLDSIAMQCLREAEHLRRQGEQSGQTTFDRLYDVVQDRYDRLLNEPINQIETIRVGLFFLGLVLTATSIVAGFASLKLPTNAEESKLFSFTIITSLGLAYVPAAACFVSNLILYLLSSMLQKNAEEVMEQFSLRLYNVVYLKETAVNLGQPNLVLSGEAAHASQS